MRPGGHGLSNQTGDTRRPNEPLGAPAGNAVPMFDLTRITIPPSLGEHCFVLRSRLSIRETAVRIDDVQHYTLPSIAQLQLPAGTVLKGSWESIYRSLLPFRDAIIDGSPLPEGEPGQWTNDMLASPSIFDLRFVIYHLSCPCNLGFLKLVGPMCAQNADGVPSY